DPGIIFIDRINRDNPTPSIGEIEATNPCGEQPLLPNEACNLGSINLSNFVNGDTIDYERMGEIIDSAVHFLDNVIDVNKYPLKKIEKTVKGNRKIGLGIMGFADMLIKMKTPYNSEEAVLKAEEIAKFIRERAREASVKLAESRGTFPNFNESIHYPDGPRLRNATLITIAPTGSISMIADCSSGIEPLFSITFIKKVMDGTELLYTNKNFEKISKEMGFYSEDLMKKIANLSSIQEVDEIPQEVRKIFVTAHDISPEWHIKIQAAFQKYTDDAVSKTINFPGDAMVEDVRNAYLMAYELGCKGITIYRDRSREEQVLYAGKGEEKEHLLERALIEKPRLIPRMRPRETRGITQRIRTGEGTLYITINEDDKGLCEVFTTIGKAGGNAAAQSEAISRLISLALRSGIDPKAIIKQLKGISGPSPVWEEGELILSTPDAIGKALENYLKRREKIEEKEDKKANFTMYMDEDELGIYHLTTCPDCGATLIHESGCAICHHCGYSKC
ncbi:MAG: adenosylcobalamin-dependent ribonucleoside-diphosphate reductase, partial [Fidelibacterota bacterium]